MDSITHPNAAEDRGLRKWFFVALAISLAFHGVLAVIFQAKKLEHFQTGPVAPRLVPRPEFNAKRTTFDEKIFLSDAAPSKPKVETPTKLTSPVVPKFEKPSAAIPDKTVMSPQVKETPKFEKPDVKAPGSIVQTKGDNATRTDTMDLGKNLIESQPVNPAAQSKVPFPTSSGNGAEASGSSKGTGAFSNLEGLLEGTGELKGPVAPVNMPGGALFEYDSADLRPDAIPNLQKLGELIARNPRATFSIEGHTDSFGTPDYNFDLSRRRAEAVKAWLVDNMHLDPSKIQTQGFGSTHLIVPATKNGNDTTREEQQINRRVEIVIRTPKK